MPEFDSEALVEAAGAGLALLAKGPVSGAFVSSGQLRSSQVGKSPGKSFFWREKARVYASEQGSSKSHVRGGGTGWSTGH